MTTPERVEVEVKTKAFNLRVFFARNFYDFLTKETQTQYRIERVKFDVHTENTDAEGVKHIKINPIQLESAQDFEAKGFFLVSCPSYDFAHLIEFDEVQHTDGNMFFVGINRTPNPHWAADKGVWKEGVLSRKTRPSFYNQSPDTVPSIGIMIDSGDRATAKITGTDRYLNAFFKSLKD